jgi:hypothetical protein
MTDEQNISEESANLQNALTKKGQRSVNLIWEFTQGVIAITITGATIYCAVTKIESQILSNAFFLIVSMYFVRTNHSLIGGTGSKPLNQQR